MAPRLSDPKEPWFMVPEGFWLPAYGVGIVAMLLLAQWMLTRTC